MSELDLNLWLDDMRPAPIGWIHVKTCEEAKRYLEKDNVNECSLDHDLGACEVCLDGKTPEQWLESTNFQQMPHCEHFGTGYTLVRWMIETGHWSKQKPVVHSMNAVGRMKMRQDIDRWFGYPAQV